MDLPKTLSFVNYAVNGAGVGHVQRLCAINRWLRRYATYLGIRSQHWFITTSEADTWLFAEDFAAFKLPSKSIVESAGIDKPEYLAMAKQWVWTAMATLRPDLFIVDTFPNGSFDELAPALDLCRKKALVLRPVRPEILERPGFKALTGLYDRVVVPADLDSPAFSLPVDPLRTGPIMLDERFEAHDRAEARRRLGVEGDAFCWLIAGGGGADPLVPAVFDAADAVAHRDPSLHLVFAAGPLCRLPPRRGARRTWWTDPGLGQVLAGVDGAVSAAGFNSVHELLHAGVPTIFLPQRKVADDQEARARAVENRGAGLCVAGVGDLAAAMLRLRNRALAQSLAEAARKTVPRNAARDAAAALLELCVPRAMVRQAVDVVDDDLVGSARNLSMGLSDVVDLAAALVPGQRPRDRGDLQMDNALSVAQAAMQAGLGPTALVRLATIHGRKMCPVECSPGRAGEALLSLIAHPTAAGQWSALSALLSVWPQTRENDPARATATMLDLVDVAATRGMGVSRLAQVVVQVQAEEEVGPNFAQRVRTRLEVMP